MLKKICQENPSLIYPPFYFFFFAKFVFYPNTDSLFPLNIRIILITLPNISDFLAVQIDCYILTNAMAYSMKHNFTSLSIFIALSEIILITNILFLVPVCIKITLTRIRHSCLNIGLILLRTRMFFSYVTY